MNQQLCLTNSFDIGETICPATDEYPHGLGEIWRPRLSGLNFADWLHQESSIATLRCRVLLRGCVLIHNVWASDSWKLVPGIHPLGWHEDGYDSHEVIILGNTHNATLRNIPTSVALSDPLWSGLRTVACNRLSSHTDLSVRQKALYGELQMSAEVNLGFLQKLQIERRGLKSFEIDVSWLDSLHTEAGTLANRWVYTHHWDRFPKGSVLAINTARIYAGSPKRAYCSVLHARLYDSEIAGDQLRYLTL